uniref:Uncharacterized protein n=1 Tax=Setaria italica TaxID=4555 RepID=K3XFN2_SETIT
MGVWSTSTESQAQLTRQTTSLLFCLLPTNSLSYSASCFDCSCNTNCGGHGEPQEAYPVPAPGLGSHGGAQAGAAAAVVGQRGRRLRLLHADHAHDHDDQLLTPRRRSPCPPGRSSQGSLVKADGHVYSMAAAGDFLYTGTDSRNIRVWRDRPELGGFRSSSGLGKAINVAADGRIYTGHQDAKVRVWRRASSPPEDPAAAAHRRVGSLPRLRDVLKSSLLPSQYVETLRHRAGETEATGVASAAGTMLAECCRRSAARPAPISYPQAPDKRTLPSPAYARPPGLCRGHTNRARKYRTRLDKALLSREPDATPRASPAVSFPHGLIGVLPALRLAPAARAHQLALHSSSADRRGTVGRQSSHSPATGASRCGRQPPEGAGARGGAGRAAVAGAAAGAGARGRGRHVPAAGAVQPGLRLLPGHAQGHPRPPRRQCATVRVRPAADVEADAGGQHPVRELLPAQVRGAVGGGEVRGREAGQGAGGGVAAHPPHQQAQRHHRGHRQPREADRLPGALRHRQHLRPRRTCRHQRREDRRPNLLQLRAGDSTGTDRFSQSGQGHRQGKHGGALRRERQRQAVVVVGEGSQGHSGLVSSMIDCSNNALCELVGSAGDELFASKIR